MQHISLNNEKLKPSKWVASTCKINETIHLKLCRRYVRISNYKCMQLFRWKIANDCMYKYLNFQKNSFHYSGNPFNRIRIILLKVILPLHFRWTRNKYRSSTGVVLCHRVVSSCQNKLQRCIKCIALCIFVWCSVHFHFNMWLAKLTPLPAFLDIVVVNDVVYWNLDMFLELSACNALCIEVGKSAFCMWSKQKCENESEIFLYRSARSNNASSC